MKKIFTISYFIFGITNAFCQKVDLDRFSFNVAYQLLPQEYIEPSERTYGTRAILGGAISKTFSEGEIADKLQVYGFKRVEQNPKVGAEINLTDFYPSGVETKSRTEERKDKDGKVTGRTTFYWVEAYYAAKGYYAINGPITPKEVKAVPKESQPVNRFLAAAQDINKSTNSGPSHENSLSQTITFRTKEYTNSSEASKDFQDKRESIRENQLREYVNTCIRTVNQYLNRQYGYTPVKDREFLWILDSKDHPEFQTQQEAIQAVKTLLEGMEAEKPITSLESNFKPLLDYFDSVPAKYSDNDKRNKKMRYSSYYNLSKLYYYLDAPEKSIEYADKLIANDYDSSDGENLKKLSLKLIEEFKRAKVNSRHNSPSN